MKIRDLINIVEAAHRNDISSGVVTPASVVVKNYGGKIHHYRDLPQEYKDALYQYMEVEGEHDDYQNDSFGVVEVPISDVIEMFFNQVGEGMTFDKFWPEHQKGYGEEYSKRWPVMWSKYGFEDGTHRLSTYYARGEKTVPVLAFV